MPSNTSNLKLLKKDPVADAQDTFNVETMLNDNWDKIDTDAGLNKTHRDDTSKHITSTERGNWNSAKGEIDLLKSSTARSKSFNSPDTRVEEIEEEVFNGKKVGNTSLGQGELIKSVSDSHDGVADVTIYGEAVNMPVINPQFKDGTNGWLTGGVSSFTIENGIAKFTASTSGGHIRNINQDKYDNANKKVLYMALVKSDSALAHIQAYDGISVSKKFHTGSNNFEVLGLIKEHASNGTWTDLRIRDDRTSGYTPIYIIKTQFITLKGSDLLLTEQQLIDKYSKFLITGLNPVENPVIESHGMNYFDINKIPIDGTYVKVIDKGDNYVRLKGTYYTRVPIRLKKNTSYRMNWDSQLISGVVYEMYRFEYEDGTLSNSVSKDWILTTHSTLKVIAVYIYLASSTLSEAKYYNIRLLESNQPDVFILYNSSKLAITGKFYNLPNGVKDIMEVKGGKVTATLMTNAGKDQKPLTLKGGENWVFGTGLNQTNTIEFNLSFGEYKAINNDVSILSNWNTDTDLNVYNNDSEAVSINTSGKLRFRILRNKLLTQDIEGLNIWLSSNNIDIIVPLSKPISIVEEDLVQYGIIVEGGVIETHKGYTVLSISSDTFNNTVSIDKYPMNINTAVNTLKDVSAENSRNIDRLNKESNLVVKKTDKLDIFPASTDGSNTVSVKNGGVVINGKTALVGYSTADGNHLVVNYGKEFANGVEMQGKIKTNDYITNSTGSAFIGFNDTTNNFHLYRPVNNAYFDCDSFNFRFADASQNFITMNKSNSRINVHQYMNIVNNNPTPLSVRRNDDTDNVSISFEGSNGVKKYLGFGSGFDLMIGSTQDLRGTGSKIWNQNNDGAGSGLDADMVHGIKPSGSYSKDISYIPVQNLNSTFEIGQFLDMHMNGSTKDYDRRIEIDQYGIKDNAAFGNNQDSVGYLLKTSSNTNANSGANPNDFVLNGRYRIHNMMNQPSRHANNINNDWYLDVFDHGGGHTRQVIHDLQSDRSYTRQQIVGTWGEWREIFNSGTYGKVEVTFGNWVVDYKYPNTKIMCQNIHGGALITVPNDPKIPSGTEYLFVRCQGQEVTFTPASGVSLYSIDNLRSIGDIHGAVTLIKISDTEWRLIGDLK